LATLYFSDEAEADLFEHWEYQVGQAGPDSADRLIDTLKATCETIAGSPNIGTPREYTPARVLAFPKNDYMIFYRQSGSDVAVRRAVEIIRIIYGRRHMPRIFK
jgi:plasmid stabilization system protein ParE